MDDDDSADGDDDENDTDDRKDVFAGDRPHPLLPSPVAGQCPYIPGNKHHGLARGIPTDYETEWNKDFWSKTVFLNCGDTKNQKWLKTPKKAIRP